MKKTPANILDNIQTYKNAVIKEYGVEIHMNLYLSEDSVFKGAQSSNVKVPSHFQNAIMKLKKKCESSLRGNAHNAFEFEVTVPKKKDKDIPARYKGRHLKQYKGARTESLFFRSKRA